MCSEYTSLPFTLPCPLDGPENRMRPEGGCSITDPWQPGDTSFGTGAAALKLAPPSVLSAAKRQCVPPLAAASFPILVLSKTRLFEQSPPQAAWVRARRWLRWISR